nr:lysophospholipid acyltransferase family protein [Nocardioides ochotonae]
MVKPTLLATTRQDWHGGEWIPASGGCLVVLNHVSHVDPFTAAHVVYDNGRLPRYLAKSSLFRNKVLRRFLTALGQIPVERHSAKAAGAYDAAVDAVRRGQCVVVYPEGTITRDPDGWPMVGKSGAARIALATGCPVIPIGQWGAQALLAPYSARLRPFPRKTIHMRVGEPVPLDDLRAQEVSAETIHAATDRIMTAITDLVAEIRGEAPPAVRYDPRRDAVPDPGDQQASHETYEQPRQQHRRDQA